MDQEMSEPGDCHSIPARPIAWVARFLSGVKPGGEILDLACGGGRHSRHALGQGYRVTCVDRNLSGVADLAGRDDVQLIEADLETNDGLPFSAASFDGVIVTNYLYRPILDAIAAAVRTDGVLIYSTFAAGHTHKDGRPFRPAYLLNPNELIELVMPRLQVVAYEHGAIEDGGHQSIVQRIAACGRDHRWADCWPS